MFSLFANVRNSLKQAAPVLLSSYGPAKRLLSIVNRASSACQPRVWNLRLQSGARRATYYAVEQPYISPIMGRTTRSAGSQAAEQKNINRILVFGTIGICYYGYNLERVPFTGRIHFVDVSPRAEVRLGDDEFRHYASTHNVMKVKDLSVFGVNDAGVRLIVRNRLHTIRPLDHLDRPIEFYIVDNPEPNAFALPGGRIVIHSGLFKIVGDDENKLAAVLAHELGHVIGRHGVERVSRGRVLMVFAMMLNSIFQFDTRLPMHMLLELPFGRKQELEADRIAVTLMVGAGYDPAAAVEVMRSLGEYAIKNEKKLPLPIRLISLLFSTHPSTELRVKKLKEILHKIGYKYPA